MPQVLISIGSNLAPEKHLPAAIGRLRRHPGIQARAVSSIYESAPVGVSSAQPAYSNAAMLVETELSTGDLKAALREIEAALGRVRTADKYCCPYD